jgi:multiple sugar transport system permease protein
VGTTQVLLEPYPFTDGGPDNATTTILLLIYDYAFGTAWAATTERPPH